MNRLRSFIASAAFGLMVLWCLTYSASAQAPPAPPAVQPPVPPQEQPQGVEVLAHGPVHEAYAQPVTAQPVPSAVVKKQPPEPINELPPDQKPEGDNVQWIPGYWAFDEEQSDYLWVSGSWRAPPPGRHWLPGHWQQIDTGWQWVAGYWIPGNVHEVHYLPAPPPSLDRGPAMSAPDTNSSYIAGSWIYNVDRFYWRPGYWIDHQPDWVWNPAYYIWTPSGYIFNDGYWDYPLGQRGLLFAPVRFGRAYLAGGYGSYVPVYVVKFDFLMGALFIGPTCQHYYFGDYFDNRYLQRGYLGWNDYRLGRGAYDPNYGYYRQRFAGDGRWERGLTDLYHGRRNGEIPRPPRTLVQQVQSINNITVNKTANVNVQQNVHLTNAQNVTALAPLKEAHNMPVTNLGSLGQVKEATIPNHMVKLAPVAKEEQAREQKAAAVMREVAAQRRQTEAKMLSEGGVPFKHTDPPKAVKFEHPNAPPQGSPPRQVEGNPPTKPPVPEEARQPPQREPPPPPAIPKHEERPIPKYEPPHPPAPPKKHGEK